MNYELDPFSAAILYPAFAYVESPGDLADLAEPLFDCESFTDDEQVMLKQALDVLTNSLQQESYEEETVSSLLPSYSDIFKPWTHAHHTVRDLIYLLGGHKLSFDANASYTLTPAQTQGVVDSIKGTIDQYALGMTSEFGVTIGPKDNKLGGLTKTSYPELMNVSTVPNYSLINWDETIEKNYAPLKRQARSR